MGSNIPIEHRYEIRDCGYATPCWIWLLACSPKGYGRVKVPGVNRTVFAHRWYWEQMHGAVPDDMELDHLCRQRACVNPDHLEPVAHVVNIRRGRHLKLTMEDARAIRSARGTHQAVGAQFGVTGQTVSEIRRGLIWKEVA